MERSRIRVLCVDDHIVVIKGLTAILQQEPDMEVVAYATNGHDAVDKYVHFRPDITLMDLQLPGMNGLEAIRAIRQHNPSARILVLTMYQGGEDIYRATEAGASGYLLKDALADNLVNAIRNVCAGRTALADAAAANLAQREREPTLTAREVQVVRGLVEGKRNKEIGAALGISEDTVHAHVKSIFVKLKVHDRTAALAVALRRGIIHMD